MQPGTLQFGSGDNLASGFVTITSYGTGKATIVAPSDSASAIWLEDCGGYSISHLNLVGTGTSPDCATFLHELRRRFPDTAVRSFECSNPSPGRNQSKGTFRFELVWYTAPVAK